ATGGPAAHNEGMSPKPTARRIREINEMTRYTMWSVFTVTAPLPEDRSKVTGEVEALFADLAGEDVVIRGVYDVAGLRADADFMVWWHAERVEQLQDAYRRLLRTEFGRLVGPVGSGTALHRPAEFNKSHLPSFLADEEPKDFIAVYPFVRSYDWYLLDPQERRALLA